MSFYRVRFIEAEILENFGFNLKVQYEGVASITVTVGDTAYDTIILNVRLNKQTEIENTLVQWTGPYIYTHLCHSCTAAIITTTTSVSCFFGLTMFVVRLLLLLFCFCLALFRVCCVATSDVTACENVGGENAKA